MTDNLLWCDLETTGLDPKTEVIMEIGFVVTDSELNEIDSWSTPVWDWGSETVFNRAVPFVKDMHKKNGLLNECRASGVLYSTAKTMAREFIEKHGFALDRTDPLCGSSVHFDRAFLDAFDFGILDGMSYRNIDVSSLKETFSRFATEEQLSDREEGFPQGKDVGKHRVIDDCRWSIAEYGFYLGTWGLI